MNWADWAIIGIFSLSCLIGLIRGFVREALSLIIWVAAVLVAKVFGGQLEILLADQIESPSVRLMTAYAVLFIATLLLGA
ncbi:MAG TPA: CvpA family protein, partial [Cellvibrio sp.]